MNAPLNISVVGETGRLREQVREWRVKGHTIALVPTMGALHNGHLTLVRRALEVADRVVVSIFVNPIQFGPNEDFAAYPRRLSEDAALLSGVGASLVYAPTVETMYPEGYATHVVVDRVSEGLCGAFRPGHFVGVASVVTKLMMRVAPDVALFGEKDYQQLQVIRRMVRDLDIPVRIMGVPTVREADGLALSSRNAYLSVAERAQAPTLHRVLVEVSEHVRGGAPVAEQEQWGRARLLEAGFRAVDYLEVRDADTLAPVTVLTGAARVLAAVHLGRTRLIDNEPV